MTGALNLKHKRVGSAITCYTAKESRQL